LARVNLFVFNNTEILFKLFDIRLGLIPLQSLPFTIWIPVFCSMLCCQIPWSLYSSRKVAHQVLHEHKTKGTDVRVMFRNLPDVNSCALSSPAQYYKPGGPPTIDCSRYHTLHCL